MGKVPLYKLISELLLFEPIDELTHVTIYMHHSNYNTFLHLPEAFDKVLQNHKCLYKNKIITN